MLLPGFTAPSQVLGRRRPVQFFRDDVIDLKWQPSDGRRQLTILTAVLGTFTDQPLEFCADSHEVRPHA